MSNKVKVNIIFNRLNYMKADFQDMISRAERDVKDTELINKFNACLEKTNEAIIYMNGRINDNNK